MKLGYYELGSTQSDNKKPRTEHKEKANVVVTAKGMGCGLAEWVTDKTEERNYTFSSWKYQQEKKVT